MVHLEVLHGIWDENQMHILKKMSEKTYLTGFARKCL